MAQLKNSSSVYLSWDDLGSNVLSYPYTDSTKTTNGITFTVNGEGDVVVTGTATADAYFTIAQGTLSQLGITAGQKFIVTSSYSGAKIVVTETNSSNVVVSTIEGSDPLQYIATSTTNTLKFSIVIPSGASFGTSQQLQPMIAIEDKIVALNDVSVTMQPIQNLHGYSNPWPAGGGKNKLPSANSISSPSSLTVTNENGQYVLNGSVASGDSIYFRPGTITIENGFVFACGNSFVNAILYFLNGTTQVDYFTLSTVNRVINTSQMSTMYGKPFNSIRIRFSEDQTFTNAIFSPMVVIDGADTTTFAPYSNICTISGRTGLSVYVSPTQDVADATTYSVDWTSQAGTVYGGTLDMVTGVLTVDWAMVDLGTLNWDYLSPASSYPYGVFYGDVRNKARGERNFITSCYPISDGYFKKDKTCLGNSWSNTFYIIDSSYNGDTEELKTALSGQQICYELATPITYQLTPQEVTTLVGQNNVWSTGDSASVTYTKDTGSQATLSGAIVTFSDSNAVLIPTPQYIPGITGISIYRYLQGESALQHVYDLATGATSILDYYAPSQMQVSYLIVAHSGIGDLFLQTTKFTPTFWFFSILLCDTDSNGDYHVSKEYIFKYGVETGAVSNNNDPTIQKNFTPYPNRQPISTLYKTGKISGYIGKTNNLNRYSDTISLQNAIYEISTSTLTKFIKTRKGDILMVDTASSIQMQTEDNTVEQALKATIDWVEVGDADQVSIVSISTDPFWPLP